MAAAVHCVIIFFSSVGKDGSLYHILEEIRKDALKHLPFTFRHFKSTYHGCHDDVSRLF